jgi:ferrous iron transport protein A
VHFTDSVTGVNLDRIRTRSVAQDGAASRLSTVARGHETSVAGVTGGENLRRRLAEFGIRTGTRIVVLQRCSGGGRVVQVGNARLALDRRALAAIQIADSADGTGT